MSADAPLPRRAFLVSLVSILAGGVLLADMVKVNVLVGEIDFIQSGDMQKLLLASYPAALSSTILLAGQAGDRIGRKWLLVSGLLIFAIFGLATGLVNSAWALVAFRTLQGIGAGLAMPQIVSVLQLVGDQTTRARAMGWYGAVGSLGIGLGPSFAGALCDLLPEGWRFAMAASAPIAAALGLFLVIGIPHRRVALSRRPIDIGGTILLTASTTALLVALISVGSANAIALVASVVGLPLLVLFLARYRYRASSGRPQLLSPRLASTPGFLFGLAMSATIFVIVPSSTFLAVWYLQNELDLGAAAAGAVAIPFSAASFIVGVRAASTVLRNTRPVMVWGFASLVIGMTVMLISTWLAPHEYQPALLYVAMTVCGLGAGCVVTPNQMMTLRYADRSEIGAAASINQLMQRFGTAAGLAVTGAIVWSEGLSGVEIVGIVVLLLTILSILVCLRLVTSNDGWRSADTA